MNIILEMIDTNKTFGKQKALSKVSIKVNDGEIFGFLGPSGELRNKYIEVKTYCSTCKNKEICGLCAPVLLNEYKDISTIPYEECKYTNELRDLLFSGNEDKNNEEY